MAESKKPILNRVGTLIIQIMSKLYHQDDTGAVYIHLDGGLRHIPNPNTFHNLFAGKLIASEFISFSNAADAPFPILTKWPIMDNAKLVHTDKTEQGILLEDKYPWSDKVVLRHVIDPNQMNTLGFDWNKVVEYSGDVTLGVPLNIESNNNINAIQYLAGYYDLYGKFFFSSPVNPFFMYLLKQFPGMPRTKYKMPLKALISKYQKIVDNLPGTVKP